MNPIEQFKLDHPEIKLDSILFQNGTAEIFFTDSKEVFEISEFTKGSKTRTLLEKLIRDLEKTNVLNLLKGKPILWITKRFAPNSKLENAIYHCAAWLLDCSNYTTQFVKIDTKQIVFQNQENMKEYVIHYSFNSDTWNWEFNERNLRQ